jgi:hypothetical protein
MATLPVRAGFKPILVVIKILPFSFTQSRSCIVIPPGQSAVFSTTFVISRQFLSNVKLIIVAITGFCSSISATRTTSTLWSQLVELSSGSKWSKLAPKAIVGVSNRESRSISRTRAVPRI